MTGACARALFFAGRLSSQDSVLSRADDDSSAIPLSYKIPRRAASRDRDSAAFGNSLATSEKLSFVANDQRRTRTTEQSVAYALREISRNGAVRRRDKPFVRAGETIRFKRGNLADEEESPGAVIYRAIPT